MAITVTVSTNNGIDLRFNTLYDEFANSPIGAGGTATQFTSVDTGAYNGNTLPIKFVISGTGFTYSGSAPNIQLTGGTINSIVELDTSNNTLVTFTGFAISAIAFQAAMNTYTSGNSSNTSALNAIFRPLQYNETGGGGADTFQGGNVDDTIVGGGGSDFINGSPGNDTLNGGVGFDLANYSNLGATGPITVVLGATSTVTGDSTVGTDTLISVERVRGTNFNDTFTLTASFSGEFGNFASFEGMGGNDTITGAPIIGNPNFNGSRAEYTQAASGVFVDLGAGTAHSIAGGDAAGIGVDTLIGVTGAMGSAFADTLTAAGGIGNFHFYGLAGNDTIIGTLHGDSATDFNEARYDQTGLTAGIAVSLGTTSTVTGDASVGTDTLVNIESVRGTSFADTFTVGVGFSAEFGAANFFEGLGGNDVITGNGMTRIEYSRALAAVTVNIGTGTAASTAGGDAAGVGTDTFSGVNSIEGSAFNDTLAGSGNAQAERFRGDAGNDTINGFGGSILDNADYRAAPGGINANLATGTVSDGYGSTDTLVNIYGIRGSEFNDVIAGDGLDNRLVGSGGDDFITGAGGSDILVGDNNFDPWGGAFGTLAFSSATGNDTLNGGAGTDTLYGGPGSDTLTGGSEADKFVFGTSSLANAQSGIFDRVTDYDQGNGGGFSGAEADQFDLSGLLSAAYNAGAGQPVNSLVRAVANGTGTSLQIDTDGAANGANWLTVARLDGVHLGNSVNVILDSSIPAGTSITAQRILANDFDTDGHGDVLFQTNTDFLGMWKMNGSQILASPGIGALPAAAIVAGIGDFNNDSHSDVLFQTNTGFLGMWQMNGSQILTAPGIGALPANANVAGVGDFNGDGRSDILFQTDTGFLGMWAMSGSQILASPGIGALPAGAHVAGVGDFDGDGHSDVLFQTTTGFLGMWQMNGSQILAAPGIGPLPAGATVAGVGDFDGDGHSDILFQTSNGFLGMWQMNGSQILSSPGIGALPANANVAEVADFNGDGHSDILFQTDTSFLGVWLMNGSQILTSPGVGPLPANAHVVPHLDLF